MPAVALAKVEAVFAKVGAIRMQKIHFQFIPAPRAAAWSQSLWPKLAMAFESYFLYSTS
jgi:hypothetical protein